VIENWAAYGSDTGVIVEYNSFEGLGNNTQRLPPGCSNAKITAINNSWITQDAGIIAALILE
jgi:hypothetical protein